MKYVFDANAVIAFFDAEPGHMAVRELLLSSKHRIAIHSLNACEVFYHFWRNADHATANRVLRDMVALGIEIPDELGPNIWKKAAALKTLYRPLSLADSVGVASAIGSRSIFVTSDRKELKPLEKDQVCRFLFFR